MKTITIYELLGMVKDGKAPKKIKCYGLIFKYDTNHLRYERYAYGQMWTLNDYVNVDDDLNDEVEILEEEKKIPEKITINENGTIGFPNGQWTARNMDKAFAMKINEIIYYFEYLKSKGDE